MSKQIFTNEPGTHTPSDTTLATQDDNEEIKSTTFWKRQSQKLKVSKLENPMIQFVYQLWKEPDCPPPTPPALNSRHLSSVVATFDWHFHSHFVHLRFHKSQKNTSSWLKNFLAK